VTERLAFTQAEIATAIKAVRKAGEIPGKVWVQKANGKTTLEIEIKHDNESTENRGKATHGRTWHEAPQALSVTARDHRPA
jgi:hypothetical protein